MDGTVCFEVNKIKELFIWKSDGKVVLRTNYSDLKALTYYSQQNMIVVEFTNETARYYINCSMEVIQYKVEEEEK